MELNNVTLDDFSKKRLEKIIDNYVEIKIPAHLKEEHKIRYKIRSNTLTLFHERPSYKPGQPVEFPVAQFRLVDRKWEVYWKDSKDRWHLVDDIEPDENFEKQLMIVDKDDNGIFWL